MTVPSEPPPALWAYIAWFGVQAGLLVVFRYLGDNNSLRDLVDRAVKDRLNELDEHLVRLLNTPFEDPKEAWPLADVRDLRRLVAAVRIANWPLAWQARLSRHVAWGLGASVAGSIAAVLTGVIALIGYPESNWPGWMALGCAVSFMLWTAVHLGLAVVHYIRLSSLSTADEL